MNTEVLGYNYQTMNAVLGCAAQSAIARCGASQPSFCVSEEVQRTAPFTRSHTLHAFFTRSVFNKSHSSLPLGILPHSFEMLNAAGEDQQEN